MYQYKAHINRKVSSCSFHIWTKSKHLVKICVAAQWKSTKFLGGTYHTLLPNATTFRNDCENKCPNKAYFLTKKIYKWFRDSMGRFWDAGETARRIGFWRFIKWPLSVKKCNTSRVKMKSTIFCKCLTDLNDTPYSYIIWIYKHTIWKSASDT